MLTVAPGGNNLATICCQDFLGLATINMYYYYYYYPSMVSPFSFLVKADMPNLHCVFVIWSASGYL